MSFVQLQLLGNVGKEPELQVTSEGTPVTKFSLAVNKPGRGKDKGKDETTWFTVIAWRGLAETLERYVHKGDTLFIQGELNARTYTTKEGKQGFSLEVTADKFSFAGSKSTGSTANTEQQESDNPFLSDLPDSF